MKIEADKLVYVTDSDRRRLGSLLASQENCACSSNHCRDDLEWILEHSTSPKSRRTARNLITMNAKFKLADLATETSRIVRLIYPSDVELYPEDISVLSPLGTQLLGCHTGDVVQCSADRSDRQFRVDELINSANGST
jgi:transcription elongation GreA/GreB family factor